MSKMPINVFKKHPSNKITFSNRAILSGELKVTGSRPKVIFCVFRRIVLLQRWTLDVIKCVAMHVDQASTVALST